VSAEIPELPRVPLPEASTVPLYFASAGHKLFAWLHQPAAQPAAGIGVVICKPFGYEALCAHRSIRAFAETAAALGMPALRFDYLGTGDSEDIDPEADQLDAWVQDIVAAVSELRRRTGVERVCLLGFRLGALLATLAAARCNAEHALILVAPVLSGRTYLRELRTAQLAGSRAPTGPTVAAGGYSRERDADSTEVSGYMLSAATIAHLSRIDLSSVAEFPVSDLLVIDRIDLPAARGWSQALTQFGVRADYLALPGLVEMILTEPHLAVVPRAMLAAMREWLPRLQSATSVRPETRYESLHGGSQPVLSELVLPIAHGGSAPESVTERPVLLGSERTLFGIVTEPLPDELRRRAVILLNAGASYHIGASRMYVSLARRWARRGYVVLRMDLCGLGDSATRPGRPDNEVFPPAALEDVRAAIDFLRARYGVSDLSLGGLCSAAYHALRAAADGLPVNRILMVNPQTFSWKERMEQGNLRLADVVREARIHREHMFSATAWKRMLHAQINVWAVARIYLHRLRIALESAVRDTAWRLRIRLPHDLAWELEEIAERGVRVVFVFARGDPGVELLRIQGGSAVKRLGDRCHVHIVDSADHTFTQSGPRAALEQILSEELFARHLHACQ